MRSLKEHQHRALWASFGTALEGTQEGLSEEGTLG